MPWTKPDFEEISLNMEVTAYVNTDEDAPARPAAQAEPQPAARDNSD
jgi:coenzyme PQQ precursor peptide PqqA